MKIPECERCRFYEANPYIVCANFLSGPDDDFCPYFALDLDAEPEELWEPEGGRFINEELVIEGDRSFYNGEEIIQVRQRWTREEQLWLLEHHPMFTGKCPQCSRQFPQCERPPLHWDCECGWMDDTV